MSDEENDDAKKVMPFDPDKRQVVFSNPDISENDFEKMRESMKGVVAEATAAFTEILDIARTTQDPKAIKAAAEYLKNVVDAQKSVMELHGMKQKLTDFKDDKPKDHKVGDVHNHIHVGSTADMMKMVQEFNNKKANE